MVLNFPWIAAIVILVIARFSILFTERYPNGISVNRIMSVSA